MGADKGNATVVINNEVYQGKTKSHLDEGAYKRIQDRAVGEVMNKNKQKVVNYLKVFKDNLSSGGWFKIYPSTANMHRSYELPKIHKQLVPLRPVVGGEGPPAH